MTARTNFAILLAALSLTSLAAGAGKNAATVNGENISVAELDAALALTSPSIMPLTPTQKKQQRHEMLGVLIDDKLVRQFLKANGASIEAGEVDRQFAALVASQKVEGKSIAGYLKEVGLTEEQVRDNFRMMLQLARYIESRVTDEKLRVYFEANRPFFDKATVRTSHIVIRVAADTPESEREAVRKKLKTLRAEITSGKIDFAAAAKAHSQCPSGPMGGDLGFVSRKFQVDEAFAKAAFDLKVGEMSDVVDGDIGVHLILATERKAGMSSKFEDAKPDIRDCYEAELRQALLVTLRKKAKIETLLP